MVIGFVKFWFTKLYRVVIVKAEDWRLLDKQEWENG